MEQIESIESTDIYLFYLYIRRWTVQR